MTHEEKKEPPAYLTVGIVVIVLVFAVGGPIAGELWHHRAHAAHELADLDESEKLKISTKGMVGTFDDFDVVGNAAFAEDLAKAWSNDAELVRIEISKVDLRGRVDIGPKDKGRDSVKYRFSSRSRVKNAHSESPQYESLRLEFADDEIIATERTDEPIDIAAPTFACPITKVIELANAEGLRKYSVDFRARKKKDGMRWQWEVSGDGGSLTICDATCAKKDTPGCP
jgi:hypothetical protein